MVKVIPILGSTAVKGLKWESLKHQYGLLQALAYPRLLFSSYLL